MLAIYRILWQRTGDRLGAIDICGRVVTTAFKSGALGQRRFKINLDQPDAFETDRGGFPKAARGLRREVQLHAGNAHRRL